MGEKEDEVKAQNISAIVALIYILCASLTIQKSNCFSHGCPSWLALEDGFF